MKKKIIFTVAAVLVLALVFSASYYRSDPNLVLKKLTKKISIDETQEVEFDYSKKNLLRKNYIPVFVFTAPEDADYSFDVTDISTEDNVFISMTVSDNDMNEYFTSDNYENHNGDVSGTEHFSKGSKCLIIMDANSPDENAGDRYKGSLKVTVSKAEEAQTPELTLEEAVTVSAGEGELASVLFRPQETGLYRFDTNIVSKKEKSGFSAVSSVKTEDKKEIKLTEGICYLEAGNIYYIWVNASDLSHDKADISVSCRQISVLQTDSPGSFSISEETVIDFDPKKSGNYAIYSVSDGNVKGSVYDEEGFPLNRDNNSGGTLSENDKDFAMVLQAKDHVIYLIHVDGEFNECTVNIAEYTGDGTSLGPDDIAQPEEAQPDDGAAADGEDTEATEAEDGDASATQGAAQTAEDKE